MGARFQILALLTAFSTPAIAQTPHELDLSGSTRVRGEAIEGQPRAGFDDNDLLLNLRTILTAEYRHEGVRIGAELYDSRVWGGDRGTPLTTGEVNTFELVQAYIGYTAPGAFGAETFAVQAGRFTLNLGSRRLVAADDYRNTTNGYTGARADVGFAGGVKATAIYVLPQVRLPESRPALEDGDIEWDRESFDLVLWGGIVSHPRAIGNAMVEAAFYHLGERDAPGRPTRDRSLNSIDLRLLRDPSPGTLDYEIEGVYQFGRTSLATVAGAPGANVSAWFLRARLGSLLAAEWKPRIAVEFDYVSGDDPGGSYGRFDTLFGMRRADLAPAGLYNSVGRANLIAPGLRFEAAPGKRFDAFATYKPLWLAARTDSFSTTGVRDPSGRAGRFAGHQIDSRIRYWLVPERLRLEGNAVVLFKGGFLQHAPNANRSGDTLYGSLNLTAQF